MTNQPHISTNTAFIHANLQIKTAVRAAIPSYKNIFIALVLVMPVTTFNSCASKKALNSTDINSITFGSGGGFTGAVTKYQINARGEIFEIKTLENITHQVKKIYKDELKTIYKKIDKLSIEQLKFSHPGNFYYFIELEKEKEKTNITWGDPTFIEPIEIKELYKYLNKLVKP